VSRISVIGGGPAGASAAHAAIEAGAEVDLYEKSVFPRHMVCGEFLSPEILMLLPDLPPSHAIRHIRLYFEKHHKRWNLPEPARGLSRFALDKFLLDRALAAGARLLRESIAEPPPFSVIAHGRKSSATAGARHFGFKAHFDGPMDDALDLFFFSGCYVGVNCVENGRTNVCGLAPENLLRERDFQVESLLQLSPALAERIVPLKRSWDWLVTGPLVYRSAWNEEFRGGHYLAGDALGFVDPFTGSGMLSAIATGRIAGRSAAVGLPIERHIERCRKVLQSQYWTSALFRAAISSGIANWALPLVPGRALFELTRPRIASVVSC
jgi:2-polyprenyl-6-methoxyphenol hydroxylase-like FAD-dependent oxidoreductase